VVIVSEETGRISVAVDGRLDRDYNAKSLKKELEGLMTGSARKKSRKEKVKK
jgi:hypothetical protein